MALDHVGTLCVYPSALEVRAACVRTLSSTVERGSMLRDVPPSLCPLFVFRLAEQHYALPLLTVERVLPMVAVSPLPQAPSLTLGVINLHGLVVPVLDLRRRFGLPAHE